MLKHGHVAVVKVIASVAEYLLDLGRVSGVDLQYSTAYI